jgi:hypothetical protein
MKQLCCKLCTTHHPLKVSLYVQTAEDSNDLECEAHPQHLLVSYENGTFDATAQSKLQ